MAVNTREEKTWYIEEEKTQFLLIDNAWKPNQPPECVGCGRVVGILCTKQEGAAHRQELSLISLHINFETRRIQAMSSLMLKRWNSARRWMGSHTFTSRRGYLRRLECNPQQKWPPGNNFSPHSRQPFWGSLYMWRHSAGFLEDMPFSCIQTKVNYFQAALLAEGKPASRPVIARQWEGCAGLNGEGATDGGPKRIIALCR